MEAKKISQVSNMEKSLSSMPFCSRRQHSFSRPQKQRTGEQHETANVKSQQKLSNCVRLFRNALKGGACGWSLDSGETQSSAIERPISTIFDKKQQDAHLSLMTMMIMGRSDLSFPAPRSSQDVPSSALCYL